MVTVKYTEGGEEKRIHFIKKQQHEDGVIAEVQASIDRNDMRRFPATVNCMRH